MSAVCGISISGCLQNGRGSALLDLGWSGDMARDKDEMIGEAMA